RVTKAGQRRAAFATAAACGSKASRKHRYVDMGTPTVTQTAKIMEVFRSIQGEGPYAGAAQVFVRFFECNMHCVWCDTPASIGDTSRNYMEMDLQELLNQVVIPAN